MSDYIASLDKKWGDNGWIPPDVRSTLSRPDNPARLTCQFLWQISVIAERHDLYLPSLWAPNGLLRAGLQSQTGNLTLTAPLTKKLWERIKEWTPTDIALAQSLSKRVKSTEPKVATAAPEVGITGPKTHNTPLPRPLSKRVKSAKPKVATTGPEVGITAPRVRSAPLLRPLTAENLLRTLTDEKTWLQSDEVHLLCSVVAAKTLFPPIELLEAQGLLRVADTEEVTAESPKATQMRESLASGTKIVFLCLFSSHWSVCILNQSLLDDDYIVCIHDSLPTTNERKKQVKKVVREYLKRIGAKKKVQYIDEECRTQTDTDSCGIFAVECLRRSLEHEHSLWSESQIPPLALRHKYLRMLANLSPQESSKLSSPYQEVVRKIREKRNVDIERGDTELWTEIGDDQDDFEISEEGELGAQAMTPPSLSLLNEDVSEFYHDATVIGDTEDTLMPNSSTTASMEVEEGSFVQSKDAGTTRRNLGAKLEKPKRKETETEEEIEASEAVVNKRTKYVRY